MKVDEKRLDRERIGVIFVHGIGEQRRFEHLDSQVRQVIEALKARPGSGITVEIASAEAAVFQAEQDSWATGSGAPLRAVVRDGPTAKILEIDFHEVWWGDINEPYSFFKQVRFWGWGLSVWAIPRFVQSSLAGARDVRIPESPGGATRRLRFGVRVRLFLVSLIAVVGAASIGIATFLGQRLLDLRPPDLIRVFVNYVAGVKLYNQKRRRGAGLPSSAADFIDSLDDPPRVSVRRRMIRALARLASKTPAYDRWYVFAHSLGTVVAFNGLIEPAYAWPGYFAEKQWEELKNLGFAGEANPAWTPPQGICMPRRPVWVGPREVAYRSAIFERFHGFLSFGSPLEKFATIWPALVPIAMEPAFRPGTTWLNIYDPIDPVSGVLRAFDSRSAAASPPPENIGYASDGRLLISHIRYLVHRPGGGTLADGVAEWLVTGSRGKIPDPTGGRWFSPFRQAPAPDARTPPANSRRHRSRTVAAWVWWGVAFIVLLLFGALIWPALLELLQNSWHAVSTGVCRALGWKTATGSDGPIGSLND